MLLINFIFYLVSIMKIFNILAIFLTRNTSIILILFVFMKYHVIVFITWKHILKHKLFTTSIV